MNDNITLHARLLTLQDEMEKKAGGLDFFVKNKAVANAIRNIASGFGKATESGLKGALGLGYWARKPLFLGGTIGATGLGAYAYGKGYTPGDVIDKGRGALIRGLGGQYDSKGGNGAAAGAAAGGAAGSDAAKAQAEAAARAKAEQQEYNNYLLSEGWTQAQIDRMNNKAKFGARQIQDEKQFYQTLQTLDTIRAEHAVNGKKLRLNNLNSDKAYHKAFSSMVDDMYPAQQERERVEGRPGY